MTELGPIDVYSTRLTGFSEGCWIAILAADGHSCFRTSFLEMEFLKLSEVTAYALYSADTFKYSMT